MRRGEGDSTAGLGGCSIIVLVSSLLVSPFFCPNPKEILLPNELSWSTDHAATATGPPLVSPHQGESPGPAAPLRRTAPAREAAPRSRLGPGLINSPR